MKTRIFFTTMMIAGLSMISCSDDDDAPEIVNEEELITTMQVVLTEGTNTVTLLWEDEDGADGPVAPVITISEPLKTGTMYEGSVTLLNESEDPAEVVNEEIEEEADEHQFFYIANSLGIQTAYADTECDYDDDTACTSTLPVGIKFSLTTSDEVGDGSLRVVLRHEPNKEAENVAAGDITNAGGATDVDVTFDIAVE